MGDGTFTARDAPVQVAGLSGVTAISGGDGYSLAARRDGTVWDWGTNSQGQLGDERTVNQATPIQVIPPGAPDLTLAVSHEGDFTVDGAGIYTLTVSNAGLAPVNGAITVTDTLPPGLSYAGASGSGWSCTAAEKTVTCTNPGPLAAGASSTIALSVDVGAAALPSVTNSAAVANAADLNPSNNAAGDPATVLPKAR